MLFLTLILLVIIVGIAFSLRSENTKSAHPPALSTPGVVFLFRMFSHPNMGKYLSSIGQANGPVVYTGVGPFKMVLLNGASAIKDAFRLPTLQGRIDCMYKEILGLKGLVWTDDSSQRRKALFKNARHFALTGKDAEDHIHDEISLLFKYFDSFRGKPFLVKQTFNIPTMNGVFQQLMGEKIPHGDPVFLSIIHRMAYLSEIPGLLQRLCVFAPSITRWVPWCLSGRNFAQKFFADAQEFIAEYIKAHQKTRVTDEPRDLVDALMDEVEATADRNSHLHATQEPITPIIFDLLSGAVETTAATLEWVVLYLSHYPGIQEKLQIEIDEVIGADRLPGLLDRPNMPYLQAFIHEIFRVAPVIPFGYHKAMEDTLFRGYIIEKGTYVIANFYGIHMDSTLWEEPEVFKPDRFINADGQFIKSENLFVFGTGRRSCVGETVARDELFLYVSRMLQSFNVGSETRLKSFDGGMALGFHCADFKASFIRRV